MILFVYAVRDRAVAAFMQPFFARSNEEALRSFKDACSDSQHQFNRHRADYVLYRIGSFDDANGFVTGLDNPEKIVDAESLAGPDSSPP